MEHKVFFTELLSLCEADDQVRQLYFFSLHSSNNAVLYLDASKTALLQIHHQSRPVAKVSFEGSRRVPLHPRMQVILSFLLPAKYLWLREVILSREKIFGVLYKALNSSNNELVEAGYECTRSFLSGFQVCALAHGVQVHT